MLQFVLSSSILSYSQMFPSNIFPPHVGNGMEAFSFLEKFSVTALFQPQKTRMLLPVFNFAVIVHTLTLRVLLYLIT